MMQIETGNPEKDAVHFYSLFLHCRKNTIIFYLSEQKIKKNVTVNFFAL
jgi:hypothetical protein